jgi:hypothetical protein
MEACAAREFVDKWLGSIKEDIPLFSTVSSTRTLDLVKGLIRRSDAFLRITEQVKSSVSNYFNSNPKKCPEGIVYLVYSRDDSGNVVPFYVGKAETIGRSGNLSALFKTTGAIRFAEGLKSNGHIGLMNEALMHARGVNQPTSDSYSHWVDAFIQNPMADSIELKVPVFINVEVWNQASVSIVTALGHMSVTTEEMIRIDLLKQSGLGGKLLNSIGN